MSAFWYIPRETVDETESRIGRAVRQWRIDAGYSQEELADRAGLSRKAIIALESGQGSRLASVIRVLRALGRLDALDAFAIDEGPSPMEALRALRRAERERTSAPRVSRSR
jgi:transcriptional regulator with XRE-family HTH domain